ncbi:MAG TPA: hypothetical protein GXZ98_03905 [Firmicutes bacterium]|jgi:hypothetical protein|nr:hypothetical protein [Bacillota bacterium]
MKDVYSRDGESFTGAMSLIVSLLIRYPEIATLKLNPANSSLTISLIFRYKFSTEEKKGFREELKMSLETLAALDRVQPQRIEVNFRRQNDLSFVEIIRDLATFSPEELSLLIKLINHRYPQELIKEADSETGEEDLLFQDEMIAHMLEELKELPPEKELIGIREEGRVMIFNYSTPP